MLDYALAVNKVCDTWWQRMIYQYKKHFRLNRKFPAEWRELIEENIDV